MDWQQTISLLVVFVTALLFVRSAVRKRMHPPSSSSSCGSCSGCAMGPAEIRK